MALTTAVITAGRHSRWEDGKRVRYVVGDTILLTDAELETHKDRVRVLAPETEDYDVAAPAAVPDDDLELAGLDDTWSFIVDENWHTVVDLIKTCGIVSDVEAIYRVELANAQRPSVLRAAVARQSALA